MRLARCGYAALLSLAACDDGPVFTKVLTTEHFVYFAEEGAAPPCNGTEEWLERYYSANAGFLGAELPPAAKLEYYFVRSREALSELGCADGSSGCTEGRVIRSVVPISAHEIVHANALLLGDPPVLFQEGLAEVLACGLPSDKFGGLADTSDPIDQLVESEAFLAWRNVNGFGVYTTSMSFVRYLIDEFGPARFLKFYAGVPRGAARSWIDAVFEAEMGVGLDDAFSDWRTKPPRYPAELCLSLMECDPTTPVLLDTEATLGCGTSGGATSAEALFRFEVPTGQILHVTTEPVQAEPAVISGIGFSRCSGGNVIGKTELTSGVTIDTDDNLAIDPAEPGRAFAIDVPPDDYVASLSALSETRVRLDVEERPSPMRTSPCEAAEEPLALDDKHQTTLTSRWTDRPCEGPWCPGQGWDVSIGMTGGALEAQALVVKEEADFSPAEIYICSEPCPADASSCEVLALDTEDGERTRSKQAFEPGTVLHLGAPAAPDGAHFAVRLRVAPQSP